MEAYMSKFGKSADEVKQMSGWMGQKFQDAGLPFNFTEKALVSNTFDAHRVLTAAYESGGAAAQDRAAEKLFHAYFAEEKAPNDPAALVDAANEAGLDGAALVANNTVAAAQTQEELKIGKQLGVTGVPHFVISKEGSNSKQQISGAQPPQEFIAAISKVTR